MASLTLQAFGPPRLRPKPPWRRNLKPAVLLARLIAENTRRDGLDLMKTGTTTSQPDERAQALVGAYERAGYRLVAPPILQPAEPFLDLSGEDIRKRMYLTADAD